MTNIPHKWVVLKITTADPVFYRVMGMWRGGYLDGDSWRINSGIARVDSGADAFLFHGTSGSVYKCFKGNYGLTAYGASVIGDLLDSGGAQVMPEDTDWVNLLPENVNMDAPNA
jgi:hypothetical protein